MIGLITQMCSQAAACKVPGRFRKGMKEKVQWKPFENVSLALNS